MQTMQATEINNTPLQNLLLAYEQSEWAFSRLSPSLINYIRGGYMSIQLLKLYRKNQDGLFMRYGGQGEQSAIALLFRMNLIQCKKNGLIEFTENYDALLTILHKNRLLK